MSRYLVIEGSISAHCCFECTVVDTHRLIHGRLECETVCECFEKEHADRIADALNKAEGLDKPT